MLSFLVAMGIVAWLFRRSLGRWLAARLPNRTTRHRVVAAIIAAFGITFIVKLAARYL